MSSILCVVANTPACARLAGGIRRLRLWRHAHISVLPVGADRDSVRTNVRMFMEEMLAAGYRPTLLPSLDLDFAEDRLDWIAGPIQLAVSSHLTNRIGRMGKLMNDVFEVVSAKVPMIYVPR